MDDMTEKMLASSTIDDPVETRQLFLEMEASLPISVRFTDHGIKGLQQQLPDLELTKDKVFAIEKLLYSGDMGGILCTISSADNEKQTIISITHLKFDPSHPLTDSIQQYQRKRSLALAITNSGTRRSAAKPKRKRRGFGS
ncbi:hypothetical protein B9G53_24475 [Pseudanabaena sp. SR411]|uniref:hypothetical protein n=1 Tax=Pseudanabaena sp. SR411 TaxID=1980935 RepID=UPI000B98C4B7|nr:hypothetical protein [Pseudanabaena sp. SR411]OYQ62004.1 hypothetical protein B9G53_24475 [Pseudanabaena sp. SR411]